MIGCRDERNGGGKGAHRQPACHLFMFSLVAEVKNSFHIFKWLKKEQKYMDIL